MAMKSSVSNGNRSVRFQIDDDDDDKGQENKRLTRKQSSESFVIHEIQPWSSIFPFEQQQQHSPDQTFHTLEQVVVHPSTHRSRSLLTNRNRRFDPHHDRITFRSLLGTMSQIHYIFTHKQFLHGLRIMKFLIQFIDSSLRGIGQLMFANNPLSGLVILLALMINGKPSAGYALLGTMISTLTAHILGLNHQSIQTGLYGSHGCLTALIISHFSLGRTFGEILGPVILLCICSTIFFVALCKIFVIRFDLSPFTFSSHLCSFIWLLCASKFRYSPIADENILSSNFSSFSIIEFSNQTNTTLFWSLVLNIFGGFFTSISQVYIINNVFTGLFILLGISICSLRLTFLALFGAIIGQLSALYLFRISIEELSQGLWGFNSALTCQTLGGMFFVLHGYHIWFYMLFGSVMTVFVQSALTTVFSLYGIPCLMLPSIIICWLLCLLGGSSHYLIGVKLRSISIPEDHLRRFRLSNIVKMHFEFLNDLSIILSKVGGNENIPGEDLTTIENEFVPILLYQGADVNATDYDLRSSLHLAACNGHLKICRILIEKFRADTNLIDDFGGTPLYDAFCHGHFHLIPYLYMKGARMPGSKIKELTFLLCAFAFEGNFEAVQYLIACEINPNLIDHNGRTSLHLAVCGNHLSIVKYLVEEGHASLSIVDHYGHTPLDNALRLSDNQIAFYLQYWRDNPSKNKMNLSRILVDNDLDDDIYLDEVFIEENESIRKKSENKTEESLLPALFCTAAGEGNVKQMINILKQFPRFRADSVDYDYRSAAHIAAAEGQLSSIEFLCKHSLSKKRDLHWINQEDRWGFTPIEEAYRYGHYQVAHCLQEYQTKESKLTSSENHSNSSTTKPVETFLNSIQKWKKVFRFATLVLNNEAELIKCLLMSGVFHSSETYADYDGRTPMHWAALNGYINVVKVLQQCGDNGRTHKDRWNNSAFDEAKRKKFMQIVHILLDDIV
ncbi:hypothetical protein I4U23_011696 [Adineta vaga]|nr:hypothetical protein I4U23_011696 [Adineta vaga]